MRHSVRLVGEDWGRSNSGIREPYVFSAAAFQPSPPPLPPPPRCCFLARENVTGGVVFAPGAAHPLGASRERLGIGARHAGPEFGTAGRTMVLLCWGDSTGHAQVLVCFASGVCFSVVVAVMSRPLFAVSGSVCFDRVKVWGASDSQCAAFGLVSSRASGRGVRLSAHEIVYGVQGYTGKAYSPPVSGSCPWSDRHGPCSGTEGTASVKEGVQRVCCCAKTILKTICTIPLNTHVVANMRWGLLVRADDALFLTRCRWIFMYLSTVLCTRPDTTRLVGCTRYCTSLCPPKTGKFMRFT